MKNSKPSPEDADQLPPNDADFEALLIGSLFTDPRNGIADLLSAHPDAESYFYDPRHRDAFVAIRDLAQAGKPADVLHVAKRLAADGVKDALPWLSELADKGGISSNANYYAGTLREFYIKRLVIQRALGAIESARNGESADEVLAKAQADFISIGQGDRGDLVPMRQLVEGNIAYLEDCFENKGRLRGLSTGFTRLDSKLGGLKPGQLIVFAARPGGAKTSLAMQIADHVAADQKQPVGVFSLEMTAQELVFRSATGRAQVPSQVAHEGNLTESQMRSLVASHAKLAKAPLYIVDKGARTITQICAKARRLHFQHGLKLIVLDYIQLASGSVRRNDTRNNEISEITGGLKLLAKELGVPIIALSQLNRDQEKDNNREPRLSDLRDSGAIESDADVVAFLHRPAAEQADPEEKLLLVKKHRGGPLGPVPLVFYPALTRFTEGHVPANN